MVVVLQARKRETWSSLPILAHFPKSKAKPTHLLPIFSLSLLLLLYHIFKPSPAPAAPVSCDRSHFRTDICHVTGDLHTLGNSTSLFTSGAAFSLRPYPRKWEPSIMSSITQLHFNSSSPPPCHVTHPSSATAVVFSTGGYTGNLFHEFNEGIIPLYLTTRHLSRDRVVLVAVDFKNWWFTKYADVLSLISDTPVINLHNQTQNHCFRRAIVGLEIGQQDLDVDPSFRDLLDRAYRPRIGVLEEQEEAVSSSMSPSPSTKYMPRLAIVSRTGSRVIENERELVQLAESIGFAVEVIRPERTTELAVIYKALNLSDAMIGVHGAAMTHLLFMRKGSVVVQIVPLGTEWAAETFYGEPAKRMGLWYEGYKIAAEESSLWREYDESDPVLRDPVGVNAGGWEMTKRVYLDVQNVSLDLGRFGSRLQRAYSYLVSKKIKRALL